MSTNAEPDYKRGTPLEVEHDEKLAKEEAVVSGDYSGAEEKTDPVEIALVRKLDRRIMVITYKSYDAIN
ncbi:MFS transporter [Colletotrichum tofieldiae]|nr:MFS transporter [Colletotrichum tofieldiae]GKT76832.1 MFS transporter [Colletotrichum tofieldiae]GKT97489.1 MFS transporter [Colletotrichum tofieldiae]